MQKLDETNQKGACRSLARKAKGRAVVYKTTAVAAALLALGFMSLPSAMASAESQIISNTTKTYTTGLSVDSAVSGPNEKIDSQSGLYVLENATVTGENALTIKAADNDTPPAYFSGLEIDNSSINWSGSASVEAKSSTNGSVSALSVKNGATVTIKNGDSVKLTSNSQKNDTGTSFGILITNGVDIDINTKQFEISSSGASSNGIASIYDSSYSYATPSKLNIAADTIKIGVTGAGIGIDSNWGSQFTLTAQDKLTVTATSNKGRAFGVRVNGWDGSENSDGSVSYNGSSLTLDAKEITISAQQTSSETSDQYVYGVFSSDGSKSLHRTVIGANAETIDISASSTGGAALVRGVNVIGGTVSLGNENAVISISAANPTQNNADGIQVTGKNSELTITADKLTVTTSSDRKATGIRVANNGKLTVDAVTEVNITGGSDEAFSAEGIRVGYFGYSASDTNTVRAASQDAVFNKAVTIGVISEKQSVRGASVLVAAANTDTENDKGGKLTFKDSLTVNATGGINASGVEIDNDFLNSGRTGVNLESGPGISAEMVINGLLTAEVSAQKLGFGARVMNRGVLTATGGMTATVKGATAYGISLTNGSSASVSGDISLAASGSSEGYGIYLAYQDPSSLTISGGNSVVLDAQGSSAAYGMLLTKGADVTLSTKKLQITSSADQGEAYGIRSVYDADYTTQKSTELTVNADDISILASGAAVGIESNWGSQFTLKATNTLTSRAQSISGKAVGVYVNGWSGSSDSDAEDGVSYNGSSLTLDAKEITISAQQTSSETSDQNVYGVFSSDGSKGLHKTVIGASAEKIDISASSTGGAASVRGVNVIGGTVSLGNANAVISISAANPTQNNADGIQVTGKNSELTVTADKLTVTTSSDRKATGIRVADNGKLTVNAVTEVNITGGSNKAFSPEGIRVGYFGYSTSDTNTIGAATQDAVFNKAVTIGVISEKQSVRGASVLVAAANTDTENDKGGKLTFKDSLTVNAAGGINASGVEIDNDFLNGSRTGTNLKGTPGISAEMVIDGLLTAEVSAQKLGFGARVMNGGVLTATCGMTATVKGATAYGISVTNGSSADISGPLSLTVAGQTAGYGIYMTDSEAAVGTDGTALNISVTGDEAYVFYLANSNLTINGDLSIQSGKIKLADSSLLLKGGVTISGGLDSVEGGLMTVAGSYTTVSTDIFNTAADDKATETGGLKDGVSSKIAFAEGSKLVLEDEYYTLKYLTSAEQNFSENAPSITMTGTLAGELASDGLKDLPEDTVLVKVEITAQGDLALGDADISGSSVGIGSIALEGGNKLTFTSDSNKTLSVIGSGDSLVSGDGPIIISVEKSGTLALGGDYTQGGSIDGEISASGSAKITISGDKGTVKEFSVSGNLTLSDNASLEIGSASKLTVSELHVDADSTVTVGSSDAYGVGKLVAKVLSLKGRAFFDPIWGYGEGNPTQVAAEKLQIDEGGQVTVGRNSTFTAGSADETAALNAVKAAGHTLAKDDITAAMLVNGSISIGSGAITVDGSVTENPTENQAAGSVTIANNALLAVNATNDIASGSVVVLEGATLNLATNSYLYVDLSEVTTNEDLQIKLADTVNSEITAENILGSSALWYNYAITDGILTASYDPTSKLVENGLIASNTIRESIMTGGAGSEALTELIAAGNFTAAANYANKKALMATASAAQILAVNTGNMIADTIEGHGSVLAGYAHKAGADLWIDINGSFSKATSYKAGAAKYGYKADLAGVTIGADYALGNGAALGGAFSFGTGSARGQGAGAGTKNDVDYYGFNLYGVLATDYVNVIGNIGYSIGKNEIKQSGVTGKPDVKTLSLGVRAEKSLAVADGFDVTPHIGIRYMNIDMDSFTAGGFKYSAKKANLAQVPFGVAFSGSFKASCGAAVKPFVDVTVAPAFGDKKVTNRFALAGGSTSDSIDARIANSSMYQGKVGLNATKGSHSLGINYGVGGGNNGRVDQSLQARYRYSF